MVEASERHAWPQTVAGGGEAGEGRPDRRNQMDLSADVMWSLGQGGRACNSAWTVEGQNRDPESQHQGQLGGNYPSTPVRCGACQ